MGRGGDGEKRVLFVKRQMTSARNKEGSNWGSPKHVREKTTVLGAAVPEELRFVELTEIL